MQAVAISESSQENKIRPDNTYDELKMRTRAEIRYCDTLEIPRVSNNTIERLDNIYAIYHMFVTHHNFSELTRKISSAHIFF